LQIRQQQVGPIADKDKEKKIVLDEMIDKMLLAQYAVSNKIDQDPEVSSPHEARARGNPGAGRQTAICCGKIRSPKTTSRSASSRKWRTRTRPNTRCAILVKERKRGQGHHGATAERREIRQARQGKVD
jgi:hypothetical protein